MIALAGLFVVSLGVGWILSGRVLRPVGAITRTAREIQATDLSRCIHLTGPKDELRDLADTIDSMLGRLYQAFRAQRQLIDDASHELRSPLAIIRTKSGRHSDRAGRYTAGTGSGGRRGRPRHRPNVPAGRGPAGHRPPGHRHAHRHPGRPHRDRPQGRRGMVPARPAAAAALRHHRRAAPDRRRRRTCAGPSATCCPTPYASRPATRR
ncbi:HAMP domain-containing protein [Actinoplanes subtropicus]|uniref:HAMP domain-containing protein n=1 Tax=Actinoplanes subtropicus TaxID=543632 RepID=UPI003CCBC41C